MTYHAFAVPRLRCAGTIIALAAAAAWPFLFRAGTPQQVQAVEPYCIAVTSDSVALKSGSGRSTPVAMLKSGSTAVDGQAPALASGGVSRG